MELKYHLRIWTYFDLEFPIIRSRAHWTTREHRKPKSLLKATMLNRLQQTRMKLGEGTRGLRSIKAMRILCFRNTKRTRQTKRGSTGRSQINK